MTWLKGVHVIAIIFWSASLIYLPILMAGHHPRLSNPTYLRLHGMVRNLYVWIASPFALLAIISGTALIPLREVTAPWFALKLLVVAALAIIHARCGVILAKQSHSAERANALVRVMRIVLPIILFPCVLWLVLAKPRLELEPQWRLRFLHADTLFEHQLAAQPSGRRDKQKAKKGQADAPRIQG